MVGIEFTLTLIGYVFAYIVYKNDFKVYGIVISLFWTNALYMIFPAQYFPVITLLIWLNVGLLVFNMKYILFRLNKGITGRG